MELIDLMHLEKWVEIEKEINQRSGFNAGIYDAQGLRITDFKKWANRLCPAIRATQKGLQAICSVAHQNIAARVEKTGQTVVDACDAGLMKFAVPILVEGEFLGVAGGCGKLRGEGRVDAYLVHRTADLDEHLVADLACEIETIDEYKLASVINYVENTVAGIVNEHRVMEAEGVCR